MKTILKTFEAFNFPWIAALVILSLTIVPPIIDAKLGTNLTTALADKDGDDKGSDSDDGDSDDGDSDDGDSDDGDSDDGDSDDGNSDDGDHDEDGKNGKDDDHDEDGKDGKNDDHDEDGKDGKNDDHDEDGKDDDHDGTNQTAHDAKEGAEDAAERDGKNWDSLSQIEKEQYISQETIKFSANKPVEAQVQTITTPSISAPDTSTADLGGLTEVSPAQEAGLVGNWGTP